MAKVSFDIPDDQVEEYLDVFSPLLRGPGMEAAPPLTLKDLGDYYGEQARATIDHHRRSEIDSLFQEARNADPTLAHDIDKLARKVKEIKAGRDKEKRDRKAQIAAEVKAAAKAEKNT